MRAARRGALSRPLCLVAVLGCLAACAPRDSGLLERSAVTLPPSAGEVGPGSVILRPARILDVASGEYLPEGSVVIVRGDRITHVGAPPPDAEGETVSLPGLTLLPGLIDAHTHLLHTTDPRVRSEGESMLLETAQRTDAQRALQGARYAREMLGAGFTTVRDLGNAGDGADLALRDAIAEGSVLGPRMLVSTQAIAGERGQFGPRQWRLGAHVAHEYRVVSGVEEARRAAREAIAAGADGLKIIVGSETAISLSQAEVSVIAEEARRAQRWVAAHCTDDAAVQVALAAGVDSIEHGYEVSDESLARMAADGVALVPTDALLAFYESVLAANPYAPPDRVPAIREGLRAHREEGIERLRRAVAAGVTVVMGSDAYYPWGARTRGEIASSVLLAYAEAGMPPLEILRSATLYSARLLRLEAEVGQLRVGLAADLVGVRGDPLQDAAALRDVAFVMADGVAVRGPDL